MIAARKPQPRRTQLDRREESDRRMLRAAMKLFARQGISGTSLAEVGLAAGYSRGLPVDRHGSKLGLIEALLESMAAWFEARVAERVSNRQGVAAVLERIEAHVDGARKSRLATTALYAIYLESLAAMPALRPKVGALLERWRGELAVGLHQARQAGEIRADIDCEQHAAIILGALRGLIIEHLMADAKTDLDAIRDAVAGLVRQAMTSPATRKATRR